MERRRLSLRTRLSFVLTGLLAGLLLGLAGLWLQGARTGIHEEVEAATRVSEQWLQVIARQSAASGINADQLLALLQPAGRIRANALEVLDAGGERLYLSPGPSYKQGRVVPGYFAQLVAPAFAARRIEFGALAVVIHPDPSRSIIDAWDDFCAMAGLALAFLAVLFIASRLALDRALKPLEKLLAALDRTGQGRFDIRLPAPAAPELARLARAYNGMADRLAQAVDENVRLESDQEVARCLQSRLEAERRSIARELHDELAQGITAVRALAGAIVQRSTDQPALQAPANSIIGVTGEMQDGVRNILKSLRSTAKNDQKISTTLRTFLESWEQRQPQINLTVALADPLSAIPETQAATLLRVTQEALTNILRHAAARHVSVSLRQIGVWLELTICDDGCGLDGAPSVQAGCGFGLSGMRERLADFGGSLTFQTPAGGGCQLCARLPVAHLSPCLEVET
ncbi:MAG: HAMP domain-containing protein [Dechloromonas sp.]|uniref:histidine kinase n=1 Tax=Candidatus Dechloromonas phosphorivorans TaxID=2899244 RepID=A0A935MTK5_9RHOO|nr:HAMP domain-containing protein [Candidatus Dechloromonas phosphorivorans]